MKSPSSIGADVMLPLVHLIPRFSFRERNGTTYDTDSNLTITFDEQKGQWVVDSCDSSSFARLPPHGWDRSCSLPGNGGTFHLIIRDDSWYRGVSCNAVTTGDLHQSRPQFRIYSDSELHLLSRYLVTRQCTLFIAYVDITWYPVWGT